MSIQKYLIGFVLSLALTLAAYLLVLHLTLPQGELIASIVFLALMQFVVQLVCFLHLSLQRNSRERLFMLVCACVVVGILISGSLWIMFTLNGRMTMTPTQMEQYMNDQQGI